MLSILAALITTACVIIFVAIIIKVIYTATRDIKDYNGEIDKALDDFTSSMLNVLLVVPLVLVTAAYYMLQHVSTYKKFYLAGFVTTCAAFGITNYQQQWMQFIDKRSTETSLPFYNRNIIPLLITVRNTADIGLCWFDGAQLLSMSYLYYTVDTLVDCEEANFQDQSNLLQNLTASPSVAYLEFVDTGGLGGFNFYIITQNFTNFLASFNGVATCVCRDLSYFTGVFFNTITSQNLSSTVNNTANAIFITTPRLVMRTFIQFYDYIEGSGPSPFNCNDAPDKLACQISRPPKFDQLGTQLCNASDAFGLLIDEFLYNLLTLFLPVSEVPKIHNFVGPPLCTATTVITVTLDVLTHADLVFEINYLKYINASIPVNAFYNVTYGFTDIFDPLGFSVTNYTGGMLRYGLAVPIRVYNITLLAALQAITDYSNVPTFIADFDYDPLQSDWNNFLNNTENLVISINEPLGYAATHGINATQILITGIFGMLSNLPIWQYYIAYNFYPATVNYFNELSVMAIYGGDFWRQFDTSGGCPTVTPLPDSRELGVLDGNFWCCLGGVSQSMMQNYIDYTNVTTTAVVNILGNRESAITIIENLFDGLTTAIAVDSDNSHATQACMISMPFIEKCADGTDTQAASIDMLVNSFLNMSSIPWRGFLVFVNIYITTKSESFVGNEQNISYLLCYVTVSMYDLAIGNTISILYGATEVVGCVAGSSVVTFGHDMWDIFGWDGPGSLGFNFRDLFCEIYDEIIAFINSCINFMNKLDGVFYDIVCYFFCCFNQIGQLKSAFTMPNTCLGIALCSKYSWMDLPYCHHGISVEVALDTNHACDMSVHIVLPNIFVGLENAVNVVTDIVYNIFDTNGECIQNPHSDCSNPFGSSGSTNNNKRSLEYGMSDYDMNENRKEINQRDVINELEKKYVVGISTTMYDKPKKSLRSDEDASLALISQIETTIAPWSKPIMTCQMIYAIVANDSIDNNVRMLFLMQLKNCMYSTVIASSFNKFFGCDILSNETFMDFSSSIESVAHVVHIATPVARYAYNSEPNVTVVGWLQYCISMNITNNATITFGIYMIQNYIGPLNGFFYNTVLSQTSNDLVVNAFNAITSYMRFFKTAKWILWDVWMNGTDSAVSNMRRIARDEINKTGQVVWNEKHALIQLFKNPPSPQNITNTILNETTHTLRSKINGDSIIHERSRRVMRTVRSSANMFKRSDGTSDICNTTTSNDCVQCSLLSILVNTTAVMIDRCVDFARQGFNITGPGMYPPQNATLSPLVLFNSIPLYSQRTSPQPTVSVLTPISYITNIDLVTIVNNIGSFLTNTNAQDKHSFVFWLEFFGTCRYDDHIRCDGEMQGFGLLYGVLLTLLIYVIITIIVGFFMSSLMGPLLLLWITFPFAVLVMAYLWTPLCGIAIPLCTIDDIFRFFGYFDTKCINWSSFLPGLTNSTCPTAAQDYFRPFVNCNDPPYNFNSGARTIFGIIEATNPSVNQYLRTTDFIYASWIRDVFGSELTFDYPYGQMPDTFKSCMLATSPNIASISIYTILLIVLIILLLYAAYQLLLDIISFITMILIIAFMSTDPRTKKDKNNTQTQGNELQNVVVNSDTQPTHTSSHINKRKQNIIKTFKGNTPQGNVP